MNKLLTTLLLAAMCSPMAAQTDQSQELQVTVSNPLKNDRSDVPVVISLRDQPLSVASALVTRNGQEIPCQLDDLNHDGRFDELCFLTDMKKKEKQTFHILLTETGKPREYPAEVYVEMMLSNKKIKESNKQDLYISQLTVENGVNAYWMIHHHGAAFESKKVGYRIYFDHRQTVDIYGKYHQGLELKDTQFYPDAQQKTAGYGDDVLWVGSTFGVGALRGWEEARDAGRCGTPQSAAHRPRTVTYHRRGEGRRMDAAAGHAAHHHDHLIYPICRSPRLCRGNLL